MSQPQYEEVYKSQERKIIDYGEKVAKATEDRLRPHITRLEEEIITLKLQIQSLKRENDLLWNKYIEDLAQEKLAQRFRKDL